MRKIHTNIYITSKDRQVGGKLHGKRKSIYIYTSIYSNAD